MDCERIETLVSAQIDGEISAADAQELASHLKSCDGCRALAEACRVTDRELREAFADRRRSADALRDRLVSMFQSSPTARRSPFRVLPMAAALALGFVLGWLVVSSSRVSQPPETRVVDPGVTVKPSVAELAFATGRVEVRPDDTSEWGVLSPGERLVVGARVRCAPEALCELHGTDGSIVRMDRGAEVRLVALRDWELTRGRIGSTVSRGEVPFGVRTADVRVMALGTRFDLSRSDAGAQLDVFEGTTRVETRSAVRVVRRGERAAIGDDIRVQALQRQQLALASAWTNALLILDGREDVELARRLDTLLASLGRSKMDHLLEKEIRSLGSSCVVPLLRYVASPRSHGDGSKRIRAARIAADLADGASIAALIQLLPDPDPAVRAEAARALERLAGTDQGLPAARWSKARWEECEPVYLRWVDWASSRSKS